MPKSLRATSLPGSGLKESRAPIQSTKKSLSYVAGGSDSTQILSISQADSSTSTTQPIPSKIEITNTGNIPAVAILVYEAYDDENTDSGSASIQTIIMPNQKIEAPVRGIIIDNANNPLRQLDGTVVDFTNVLGDTSSTMDTLKSDTGDNSASGEVNNTTDPVVFELDNGHEKYRVGDMLRIENEIVRVEGTFDDNPTSSTVADNHIVVSRAHLGSAAASHSGTADIYFHCYNELYDYDRKLLGSSQLNMTDSNGRYKLSNFFGYARVDATSDNLTFGLVPGATMFRFYSKASQQVSMGGAANNILINAGTDSQLSTSTAYAFNLTVDDSTASTISFTTDSSVTTFGGANGIVQKLNSAITDATQTVSNNIYGYSCTVSIVSGMLQFTSNSHCSPHDGTNGSKILLADAGSGTNLFSGSAGIFPDDAVINAPVAPVIAPRTIRDPITYAEAPNVNNIMYDNGKGQLIWNGSIVGNINNETGAFYFTGGPANAEFEIALTHGTPHAGKLDTAKEDTNCLSAVHGNVLNKTLTGELKVEVF